MTAACENGATFFSPPRDVRDIRRHCALRAVVVGRQAQRQALFFTRVAVCARERPLALEDQAAQSGPVLMVVCTARCWVCFITTNPMLLQMTSIK